MPPQRAARAGGHRAGGLLASRRLMDSVVFDLCRGPGTVAQGASKNAAVNGKKKKKRRPHNKSHWRNTAKASLVPA
jgi:hypothetical protein